MYTRRTGLGCQVVTDWCTCTAIAILAGPSRATTPSTPAVARPALRWVTCRTLTSVFDHDRSIIFCRFLTLGQSPSRTAVKIRCRSCPTFLSWARQLTASQSRSSPGPFTIMGAYLAPRYVHLHWHQALTGSPGSRQLPFGPSMSWYPAGYPRPRPWRGDGTLALVPAAFRLAGLRFPAILSRLVFRPSCDRPTGTRCRTMTGFPRSAHARYDRIGCPLYPGTSGAHTGRSFRRPAACRITAT